MPRDPERDGWTACGSPCSGAGLWELRQSSSGQQSDATPCSYTAVRVSPDGPGTVWAGGGGTEHPQPRLVLHPEPVREICPGMLGDVPHPSARAAPPAPGHQSWSLQGSEHLFFCPSILQTPWQMLHRLCACGVDSSLWRKILASKPALCQSKEQIPEASCRSTSMGAQSMAGT